DIISNISSGSKMPRADWKFMSTEVFNIPLIEEQEKIANFLTKVDKIIEKQDEKVNNLEQYKKGMMQKIFSQEIRFKKDDGEEYPKWKEIKLDNLGETYTGLSG
ncbi:restriction endonuclease subunit S, partial [Clostridium saudiense]|nr:restriction endonuclease subunit S [Clostridium saudiense]